MVCGALERLVCCFFRFFVIGGLCEMSPLLIVALATIISSGHSHPQSNYADQANNVEYVGGLPEQATLDGKVTKLDDLSPVIFLNRTKAALNCAAGSMQVELKFNEPFHGVAYAHPDRNSPCFVHGAGNLSYKIDLPLKGCGTKQAPQRVFTNNIIVRFHPSLEIDGDEIITIVCRYPPPVAPLPPVLPEFIKNDNVPQPVVAPPLNSFQIMLIICGILFLSLLLLGLGCTNYCLRRRVIPLSRPFLSIGTNSEITKLSSGSLGNLSIYDPVKIPRAHAPIQATASSSGSDGPLISDTLPSDYPSESHSEIEELDARSLPVSSAGSFENRAYLHDNSSVYSDGALQTVATTTTLPRASAYKEQPRFEVQMKVNRAPPSPASLAISDTDSSVSRTERNLSTILEREESSRPESTQFTYIPELHHPPRHIQPAPTFNKILKRQQELQELASLNSEMTDTHSITEMFDSSHRIKGPAPPPPPMMPREQHLVSMDRTEVFEPMPMRKPEITSHTVDDVYLRTITEKKTIEDIERHKRLVTEYHTRPAEAHKWDVTIRNYPLEMPEPPEWENFSDISSASGLTLTNLPERYVEIPPKSTIDDNKLPLNSPELVGSLRQPHYPQSYLSTFELPIENPEVPNWNVLLRVLQPTEQEVTSMETTETFSSQLTMADKIKWRQIITTESTLRTLLTEAVVREDYERIRRDARYEQLFEPPKWDVIIRILAPNDKQKNRFKKRGEWDNRSRRSSLPTLYEYDSDGESSVRTLTREPMEYPLVRSRRTSRSSFKSEADLRSMSEMTVDFGRTDFADNQSESSHYFSMHRYDDDETDSYYRPGHPSLARSLSQPSLARSASEFTEHWGAPSRYDTASEYTSPEVTPKAVRSTRMMQMQPGQPMGAEQRSMWQASSSQMRTLPGGGTAQIMTSEMSQSSSRVVSRQRPSWHQ
ncbi:uncharacterized protein LOC123679530 isoform X1 [Harmonia axyridis]|uniref:uncharacterized protein LOC123679530 isoform X1 n=2 Tax=Harmonia axyridis TaxID=115357 RepID=UPI001E276FB3|nr:uncharacterized protein LOC123679530 isoform X1 [Harmonia axyridis]